MSVETPNYDNPEIRQRFEEDGYNWEEIKARLDALALAEEVDTRLDELAGNIEGSYSYLKSLIETSSDEEESIVDAAIEWGTEAIQEWIETAVENAENWGKSQIEARLWGLSRIPLIWEWLSEFVFNTIKDSYESQKSGFLVSILWFFGFKNILEWYASRRNDEQNEETPEGNAITETPIAQETTEWEIDTSSETVIENPEELRGKTTLAGYRIITELSGLDYGENSSEWWIISRMWTFSLWELKATLSNNKSFKEQFWDTMDSYSEEEIATVVLGVIGPVNEEFFEARLSPENIQEILFTEDGSFSELARKYFSEEELDNITQADYSYERIKLPLLWRLSAISMYSLVWSVARNATQYMRDGSENLKVFLLSEETIVHLGEMFSESETESTIYPERLSLLFDDILDGSSNFNKTPEQLASEASPPIEIGSGDYEKLQALVAYRTTVMQEIPEQFSHNTLWFEEAFRDWMDWGKLIFLYVSTNGKSPSELQWYEKAVLYSWIHSVVHESPEIQSNYFLNLAEHLYTNNDEKSRILTVILARVVGDSAEDDINVFQRTQWAIDNVVEWTFWLDAIEDDRLRRLAIMGVEIGGLTLLIKLFSRMPVMRAVILATSGVVVASIVFGVKQWLHNSLQGEVRNYYLDYLDTISRATSYGNKETLIAAIESQDFDVASFGQEILSIDLADIAESVFWDKIIS